MSASAYKAVVRSSRHPSSDPGLGCAVIVILICLVVLGLAALILWKFA